MRCVFILFILLSTISFAAEAQAPEIGRIGLYADSSRTANEVDLPAPYVSFELYIFCQPSENGMFCADFALEYPSSIFIVSHEWHPDVAIVLGDVIPGVSACFVECRADWVCIYRATMMSMESGPASINIVRHSSVGYYQFVTCLEGRPLEPVFFGPGLCINSSCPPDTDPPVPVSIEAEDDSHLTLRFDEKVFEPDADIPSSFNLYPVNAPADSISVIFSRLQGDDDEVWMILGDQLAQTSYIMEVRNLRDIAGNEATPGTSIAFGGLDTTPPGLLYAYAPDDSTAVLVFTEALDEASAEDISNYTTGCDECLTVPQAVSAELQPDGMSVVLNLVPPLEQVFIYEVTVEGVTDIAGNAISPPAVACFKAPDTFPPYVTGVSIVVDTALSILWSEVLDPVSAVDLVNYSLYRAGPPAEPMNLAEIALFDGTYVRLSFVPAIETDIEYTLFVSGVMDSSMNVMQPDTFALSFPDTIPPFLQDVVCVGVNTIDLTFSEPVDPMISGSTSHVIVYPLGYPQNTMLIDDTSLLCGGTVIRIRLVFGMTIGADYTVRAIHIPDPAGNSIPSQTRDFTCHDSYSPEVLEIFLSDFTHVHIQFDEVVNEAAEETANYALHETADSSALVGIESAVLHNGGSRVILTTVLPLADGEMYTLGMSGIEDMFGNVIDPDTAWTFLARDVVTPVLLHLMVTSDSIVHLEFSEQLDPVTAEDVGNYAVVGAHDTSIVLELHAAALDSAGTTVDLEIDGHGEAGLSYEVWIAGVTDIAGNPLYTASGAFQFIDEIPPLLLSAEASTSTRVLARFNEGLDYTSARNKDNYTIHIAGDSLSTVNIRDAVRQADVMSVLLYLSEDMEKGVEYTLEVQNLEDMYGNIIEPSTADFHFLDLNPPEIEGVDMINPTRLSVSFNEPVDSATASDTGNYSVYLSSDASHQVEVTSIDWLSEEVRLDLAEQPQPNVEHTVRIEGVEDRYGNACPALYGQFVYSVDIPSALIALYADDGMYSNYVEVMPYIAFRIYVWIKPGGNGAFAAEYALSTAQTYVMTNVTLNPAITSLCLGDPFSGHSVAFSMCATDWVWIDYLDCISLHEQAEVVWAVPHPETGQIRIATCEDGHPLEVVEAALPLAINYMGVGTLLENWSASYGSGGIEISWSILDTGDVPAFEVSRTFESVSAWQPLPAGLIRGDGLKYTMLDPDLEYGMSYRYRVEYVDEDGRKILFETDAISTPTMPLTLRQNSPNPFNPATEIGFFLPQPGHVRLEIFGVNGKLVNVLADGHHASGEHSVEWDGRDRGGSHITSGVYFYRLTAGKESLSRKMVLLR